SARAAAAGAARTRRNPSPWRRHASAPRPASQDLPRVAAVRARRYPARSMAAPSHVVFVVPFLLESSLRFAGAAGRLPGVRLALVSQDPPERLPAEMRPLGGAFRPGGAAL